MIGRLADGAYTCTEHPRSRMGEEEAFIHLREFHGDHLAMVNNLDVEVITGRRELRAARRAVRRQHRAGSRRR